MRVSRALALSNPSHPTLVGHSLGSVPDMPLQPTRRTNQDAISQLWVLEEGQDSLVRTAGSQQSNLTGVNVAANRRPWSFEGIQGLWMTVKSL